MSEHPSIPRTTRSRKPIFMRRISFTLIFVTCSIGFGILKPSPSVVFVHKHRNAEQPLVPSCTIKVQSDTKVDKKDNTGNDADNTASQATWDHIIEVILSASEHFIRQVLVRRHHGCNHQNCALYASSLPFEPPWVRLESRSLLLSAQGFFFYQNSSSSLYRRSLRLISFNLIYSLNIPITISVFNGLARLIG